MTATGVASRPLAAAWRVTGLAMLAGPLVVLVVVIFPRLRSGMHSPDLHIALETANGLIAALTAYLIYGRFERTRLLRSLLLGYGLAVLAVAGGILTPLEQSSPESRFWLSLPARVVAASILCAASLIPSSKQVGTPRLTHEILPGVGIVLGAVVLAFAVADALPAPEERDVVNPQIYAKVFGAPAAVTCAHVLNMLLYGTASYAFTRRAYVTRDRLLAWIGAGMAVASGSWLVYAIFPPVFADHLYAADFLRVTFHVLLLVGATREISSYWGAVAKAAATEERRRLARDLHDGVVQELGHISRELRRLDGVPTRVRSELESATTRALDEARDAIDVWSRPTDEPVARALARSVADVARRYDVLVRTSFDDVSLDGRCREALVRVAREAVGNAARNGGASVVDVGLFRDEDGYVLRISDDGKGFDVAAVDRAGVGYGLTSMRERAESLGGRLVIDSAPGKGTRVEMRWL